VSKVFRELVHTHHGRSSGWLPDALTAATAQHNGLDRYTLNR
jgi:predicted nucleic acid-binding protein